jgi:hypothetical protein
VQAPSKRISGFGWCHRIDLFEPGSECAQTIARFRTSGNGVVEMVCSSADPAQKRLPRQEEFGRQVFSKGRGFGQRIIPLH